MTDPGLRFWLNHVEAEGGLWEPAGDATLVVLPRELSQRYRLAEELVVTDDPDVARGDGAALLATGHPVLTEAARSVLDTGDVGVLSLDAAASPALTEQVLQDRAREQLPISHGRIDALGRPLPVTHWVLQVGALATYTLSAEDEFQERIERWIHVGSRREVPAGAVQRLVRAAVAETPPPPGVPDDDLLAAVTEADRLIEAEVLRRRAELAGQAAPAGADEARRATVYYADVAAGIERRMSTAPADRQALLRARLDSTMEEQARRLAEIAEKYEARHEIRPYRLRLLAVPALRLAVDVRRGERRYPMALDWLVPAGVFAAPRCPSCASAAPLVAGKTKLACLVCATARPAPAPRPPAVPASRPPTPTQPSPSVPAPEAPGPTKPAPVPEPTPAKPASAPRKPPAKQAPTKPAPSARLRPDGPGGQAGPGGHGPGGPGAAALRPTSPRSAPSPPANTSATTKPATTRPPSTKSASAKVAATPARIERLVVSVCKGALEGRRRDLRDAYTPGSPAAALHQVYGYDAPLVAVGSPPPDEVTLYLGPSTRLASTWGLVEARIDTPRRSYPFTLRWQEGPQSITAAEIITGAILADGRFANGYWIDVSGRRVRSVPVPAGSPDPVTATLLERGAPWHGVAVSARAVASWFRVRDLHEPFLLHEPTIVAAAIHRLVAARAGDRALFAAAADAFGVDEARLRQLDPQVRRALGLSPERAW